jgi:hypothetical protein
VKPGQFFILKFDFSCVNRSPDIDNALQSLNRTMAGSFKEFYKTYSTYLGGDEEKLLKLIVLERPAESLRRCVRLVQKAISEGRDSGE